MKTQRQEAILKLCPTCGHKVRAGKFEVHVTQRCENPRRYPFTELLPPPNWLMDIVEKGALPEKIPLRELLDNSCYYPASGLDASPVMITSGFVQSFIYCDYGISEETFHKTVNEVGFKYYQKILHRSVSREELVPNHWVPETLRVFDELGEHHLSTMQNRCVPFGEWSIWQRKENFEDSVGPKYFSFFFMGGEGCAAYQGLFLRNQITPTVLAIIQPGHAFGGNWTNFTDPNGPFWGMVLKQQTPKYLLVGGYYDSHSREIVDCPFGNYRYLGTSVTSELDRTVYTDGSANDDSRLALLAQLLNSRMRRHRHTVNIFERI